METTNELDQKISTLEVSEMSKTYLKTTSSWTTFLSVLNFISIGFVLLAGIMMIAISEFIPNMDHLSYTSSDSLSHLSSIFIFIGLSYIIMAVVLFFPALYLFRFSQKTSKALLNEDTIILEDAFKNMKSYWKFTGIIAIIGIALLMFALPIIIIARMP